VAFRGRQTTTIREALLIDKTLPALFSAMTEFAGARARPDNAIQ
jgi:hypothetical protein